MDHFIHISLQILISFSAFIYDTGKAHYIPAAFNTDAVRVIDRIDDLGLSDQFFRRKYIDMENAVKDENQTGNDQHHSAEYINKIITQNAFYD
jgi:disulfide oxidoreductase YuzD